MFKRSSPSESSRLPEFRSSAVQFLLGAAGLALITFAAIRLDLQPGSTSLLYLIDIVFVSLNSGFVYSIAVSLVAVSCLNFYFLPLFDPAGSKNPLAIVATIAFLVTAWVITGMVARVRKLTEAQLTLRFEERLAERTRIARELHDTLLQSFQGLMLHFQAVHEQLPPGEPKEALEKAFKMADSAIAEGREAIQGLRPPWRSQPILLKLWPLWGRSSAQPMIAIAARRAFILPQRARRATFILSSAMTSIVSLGKPC